jgi:protein dithiol oxidoreductase (disulfide-forming)
MKLKSLLCTFVAAITFGGAGLAAAQTPQAGTDYSIYDHPQATDAPAGKIEVTEFFFYTCPHCADMEPVLEQWAKTLPKDVSLRRVPVLFRPQLAPFAKIYYTLEAMNLVDKLHAEVFVAIHKDRANLADEKTLFAWVASKGVDAAKFEEVYKSFSVASKVERANQTTRAYNVPGTPAIAVNGKYLVASGDHARQLQITNFLINRARSEQKK